MISYYLKFKFTLLVPAFSVQQTMLVIIICHKSFITILSMIKALRKWLNLPTLTIPSKFGMRKRDQHRC